MLFFPGPRGEGSAPGGVSPCFFLPLKSCCVYLFLFSCCFVLAFVCFFQDLEARAAHLEECKANLDDPGPLHDCVVWKGGGGVDGSGEEERWWAAVDIKEDGDLTQAVAMTDFDKVRMCVAASQRVCYCCYVELVLKCWPRP